MLRADCGTENSLVGTIQLALRSLHLDQWHDKAIRFGKSTTNTVSDVLLHVQEDDALMNYTLHPTV